MRPRIFNPDRLTVPDFEPAAPPLDDDEADALLALYRVLADRGLTLALACEGLTYCAMYGAPPVPALPGKGRPR